jgi:hypothetical protein
MFHLFEFVALVEIAVEADLLAHLYLLALKGSDFVVEPVTVVETQCLFVSRLKHRPRHWLRQLLALRQS